MAFQKNQAKKASKGSSILEFGQKFANINHLIKMGLIKIDPGNYALHMYSVLWNDKDSDFINNWCKNMLVYCCVMNKESLEHRSLNIFEIETGSPLGSYSIAKGFK